MEAPKGTLLYDAIYLASNEKMAQQNGRKAMIILTDGDDVGSDHKIQEAIAAAQKSNTIIYVILIAEPSFYGGFGYNGYSAAQEDFRGNRRSHDQRRGQRQETRSRLRSDRRRTSHRISGQLHTYATPSRMALFGTFLFSAKATT